MGECCRCAENLSRQSKDLKMETIDKALHELGFLGSSETVTLLRSPGANDEGNNYSNCLIDCFVCICQCQFQALKSSREASDIDHIVGQLTRWVGTSGGSGKLVGYVQLTSLVVPYSEEPFSRPFLGEN